MKINKIYCDDVFNFLKKLPKKSIDLCIADPPYNINIGEWDTFNNEKEYFTFMKRWIRLLLPRMKDSGSIYLFNNQYNSAILLNTLTSKGWKLNNWITWYKKDGFHPTKTRYVSNQETITFYSKINTKNTFNYDDVRMPYLSTERFASAKETGLMGKNGKRWFPNCKGKLCTDVWEFSSDRHNNKQNGRIQKCIHPTPKPEKLIERIILASSNENNLVLDLFSGTGTTSYVAKKNKRNFIGCDNKQQYVDYSLKRLEVLNDKS